MTTRSRRPRSSGATIPVGRASARPRPGGEESIGGGGGRISFMACLESRCQVGIARRTISRTSSRNRPALHRRAAASRTPHNAVELSPAPVRRGSPDALHDRVDGGRGMDGPCVGTRGVLCGIPGRPAAGKHPATSVRKSAKRRFGSFQAASRHSNADVRPIVAVHRPTSGNPCTRVPWREQ